MLDSKLPANVGQAVFGILSELVAIQSVNPAFSDDAAGEGGIVHYLEKRARHTGLRVTRQPVFPGRDNLIIELDEAPDENKPVLLLEAHMDTVSLGEMAEPLTLREREGRLYGRGSCDTKGSLAAMLCALETAARTSGELSCRVILCASVDEEYRFAGVLEFLKSGQHVDGAIVGEPTGLRLVTAHKGVCRFAIHTHGEAAHSSVPEEGNSAITQMLRVLRVLEEKVVPPLTATSHPLCGSPTLVVGTICGGTQINIVPAKCTIEVDRRIVPGESAGAVLQELERTLTTELAGQGVCFSIEELLLDEPLESEPDSAIACAAARSAAAIGLETDFSGVPYGSDASKLQALGGIPSLVFGPGSIDQAHSAEEYVERGQLEQAVRFYQHLMRNFGKSAD